MPTESLAANTSIADFLDAAAAKRSAPGGGSVTALVGALATTMGEMVVNYSLGKPELAAHQAKLNEVMAELKRARGVMVELMIEDQSAFAALTDARKACNNAGDRDPRFAAALLACIRIPQTIGATAAAVLELCGTLAPISNKFLLSDLAVCAELSMATVRCAAYNVLVNLDDVSDAAERDKFEKQTADVITRATSRVRQIVPSIWSRLNS